MTKEQVKELSYILQQGGDATRLQVLLILSDYACSAGELVAATGRSQAPLSHHLALLRHGRLIESNRDGQHVIYSLTDTGRKLAEFAKGLLT